MFVFIIFLYILMRPLTLFRFFKHQRSIQKNSSAGIQTHNHLNSSLLPLPLDWGEYDLCI